jgi:hypothetical protein
MAHGKIESDPRGELSLFDENFELLASPKVPRPVRDIWLTQILVQVMRRLTFLMSRFQTIGRV